MQMPNQRLGFCAAQILTDGSPRGDTVSADAVL